MINDETFRNLVLRLLLAIYWCASGRNPIDSHNEVIEDTKKALRQ